MSRFVSVVTPSGVAADVSGTGSTIFCGDINKTFNVPGAFNPIFVCCDWTTPISGAIEIDVNFSCYDHLQFRGTFSNYGSSCSCIMMMASNACIDAVFKHTASGGFCYCDDTNHFSGVRLHGCNCQSNSARNFPHMDGGPNDCMLGSFVGDFFPYAGHSCCINCDNRKHSHIATQITLYGGNLNQSSYSFRQCIFSTCYSSALSVQCYCGRWPPAAKAFSSFNAPDFCKIVINEQICRCLTPRIRSSDSTNRYTPEGTFFGLWGRLRQDTSIPGLSSVYKTE
jgi:hypothetical protein